MAITVATVTYNKVFFASVQKLKGTKNASELDEYILQLDNYFKAKNPDLLGTYYSDGTIHARILDDKIIGDYKCEIIYIFDKNIITFHDIRLVAIG